MENNGMEYCTDSIVAIVEAALHNLETEHVKNVERNMSPDQFFEEFRHVRIKLPRRMGHSTAAIKLLLRNHDSLMVTAQENMKCHTMSDFFGNVMVNEDDGPVYNFLNDHIFAASRYEHLSKHVIKEFEKRTKKYDLVIIDMTSFNSRHRHENDCVRTLLADKTKLFVELQ